MVDSVLHIPNPENTTWRQVASGKQAKRGTHAEMQAYDAVKSKLEANVLMFVQDGAPCETCHPFFREESSGGERSFIFCINRGGYVVFLDPSKGDKIGGMHLPVMPQNEMTASQAKDAVLRQINMNGWIKLSDDQLPAVIYFHNGLVFLDAKPHDFPPCPSLLAGYG
jgi:hypothetical protein